MTIGPVRVRNLAAGSRSRALPISRVARVICSRGSWPRLPYGPHSRRTARSSPARRNIGTSATTASSTASASAPMPGSPFSCTPSQQANAAARTGIRAGTRRNRRWNPAAAAAGPQNLPVTKYMAIQGCQMTSARHMSISTMNGMAATQRRPKGCLKALMATMRFNPTGGVR